MEISDAIGRAIDRYAEAAHPIAMRRVASETDSPHFPPEMRVGLVDEDGWAQWRLMPSTLSLNEIERTASDLGTQIPSNLASYLRARAHLFDQIETRSSAHNVIEFFPTPTIQPLRGFLEYVRFCRPLLASGYLPCAGLGDGWGPLCIDVMADDFDGNDGPIVFIDHDDGLPTWDSPPVPREDLARVAKPTYPSFLTRISDTFGELEL